MKKGTFISHVLENQKLTTLQKERFLKLIAKELPNLEEGDKNLMKKVEDFESRLNALEKHKIESKKASQNVSISESPLKSLGISLKDANGISSKDKKKEEVSKLIYLDPKSISQFLLEYNQDPILKTTCHPIDSIEKLQNIIDNCPSDTYVFKEHLDLIHKQYNKLTFKFRNDKISKNIIGLISRYLGTYKPEDGWSENIKMKWISPELLNWCSNNPGKVPNALETFQNEKFRFETIKLKSGNKISNFSDLVIHFKHLFHIKRGNTLMDLIKISIFLNFNDKSNYTFTFDQDFSNTIDLFTYTDSLIQAFNRIIRMSKSHIQTGILNVNLSFGYDTENNKVFKITILNSKVFGKDFNSFRIGDDIENLIKYQINGLCNFYIKAYFNDKKANGLVNIWNGNEITFQELEEEIDGVVFIMKMY